MTPVRVLVVDDTPELVQLVTASLHRHAIEVEAVPNGEEAIEYVRDHAPDVVVLDIGLPGIDGIETCRRIREFSDAYILMLTGRADEADRVAGLEMGADDYLTKPFAPTELVARVRALLRRPRTTSRTPPPRRFTELTVDLAAREVRLGDTPLELTRIEFELLNALTEQPRVVIVREELLARVWGDRSPDRDHVVDVHISNLRRKLGDHREAERRIDTIRGVGFRFNG